jgi:hypothetical protein
LVIACGGGGGKSESDSTGLTEGQRKQAHWDYWDAHHRAADVADEQFGVDTRPDVPHSPDDIARFRRVAKERGDFYLALSNRYLDEVAKKHGITRDQLTECSVEGDDKKWPVPSRKGPRDADAKKLEPPVPAPPMSDTSASPVERPEATAMPLGLDALKEGQTGALPLRDYKVIAISELPKDEDQRYAQILVRADEVFLVVSGVSPDDLAEGGAWRPEPRGVFTVLKPLMTTAKGPLPHVAQDPTTRADFGRKKSDTPPARPAQPRETHEPPSPPPAKRKGAPKEKPQSPKKAPNPPAEKPRAKGPTITPVGKEWVPVALTPKDLGDYKQATDADGAKMLKDGVVQLVSTPTEVSFEYEAEGLAYIRMPKGPLEGRLVVVEARYVK